MKNIGYCILIICIVVIAIPLIILNGVGQGSAFKFIANPGGVSTFEKDQKLASRSGSPISNDSLSGGIKIKVFDVSAKKAVEMDLEEYIRGVVCAEEPVGFEAEALKAQAVAARTYAVTRMLQFGGKGCSNHPGTDICTDSHHCQAWISKENRFKSWGVDAPKYWQKITEAVNATKGLILTYDAAPVMYPLFFSTSSGKTENSGEVFSTQYPYLRSVVSPDEESAPKFVSKATFSRSDVVNKFRTSQYKIKLDKGKLQSQIKILSRTEGGSVKNIKVGTKTLTGTEIRTLFNLNSANFNISFGKNDVTFSVTGYGHGVGMSQWGANAMAKQGKKYDEILKHYYIDVGISSIQNVYKAK